MPARGLLGRSHAARGRELPDHRRSDRAFSGFRARAGAGETGRRPRQPAPRPSRSPPQAEAIERACDLIAKDGRFHDQFVVDAVQGGAGTSTNMNANEVIANVALETDGATDGRLRGTAPERRRQHGAVDQRRLPDGAAPVGDLRARIR